ncbi:hypothetical protein Tco_0549083 [Tanacetum coccineum]
MVCHRVATLRALVHAGDKTSGDARSWYMISEDAKSWRPASASRGEGTGGRAGRGDGRTRGRYDDQGDGRINGQGVQVGGQGSDQGRGQGNSRNQNGDAVNDNIWGDVSRGCTYKEFLACNSKEYDGKGGAIVYRGDVSRDSQKGEVLCWLFVSKDLHMVVELSNTHTSREATVVMSWEDYKTLTRENFAQVMKIKVKTEL